MWKWSHPPPHTHTLMLSALPGRLCHTQHQDKDRSGVWGHSMMASAHKEGDRQGSLGQGWPLRLAEDPREKSGTEQVTGGGGLSPTSHVLSLFTVFLKT